MARLDPAGEKTKEMNPNKTINAMRSSFLEDFSFDVPRLRTGSPQL